MLLVLALVTPLFSPFNRKVETEDINEGEAENNTLQPVSIILAEHDCSHYLERVLPLYLNQEYKAGY